MTSALLIKVLTDELKKALWQVEQEAEYQDDRLVSVYDQSLPKSNFEDDSYYPLVMVSLQGLEDNERGSSASFVILVGVYGGEDDLSKGYLNLVNLTDKIRLHLLAHRVIGEQMIFQYPLVTEVVDPQPEPFLFAKIGVEYKFYQPTESI